MGPRITVTEQRGARWLAAEAQELGAEDAHDRDVSQGTRQQANDPPPPGFKFFECMTDCGFCHAVAELRALGFRVVSDTSLEEDDRS